MNYLSLLIEVLDAVEIEVSFESATAIVLVVEINEKLFLDIRGLAEGSMVCAAEPTLVDEIERGTWFNKDTSPSILFESESI